MKNNKILSLRVALLMAVSAAEAVKGTEDGGTSNMDTPTVFFAKVAEICYRGSL